MKLLISDYQWLVGLIIGFLLNQVSISINRLRRTKDRKKEFKKHIIFIKYKLDYVSTELVKIPNITYGSEEAKESFILSIADTREYLLNIPKHIIPERLINNIAELTGDYIFFINSMRNTKIGRKFFDYEKFNEEDDRREFVIKVTKRQKRNVEEIFNYLNIK